MTVFTQVAKNLDLIIFSTPLAACTLVGVGMQVLEQTSSPMSQKFGWLGTRLAIAGALISGIPLAVYSVAKLIFATLLNNLTLQKTNMFNSFQKSSEIQLWVVLGAVGVTPLAILSSGPIIKTAYVSCQKFDEYKGSFDEVINSPEFQKLKEFYDLIEKGLSKAESDSESSTPYIEVIE